MMRFRDKLFYQFRASTSANDLWAFTKFRKRVVNELRESKKNYYQGHCDEHSNNMKILWKGINNIVS